MRRWGGAAAVAAAVIAGTLAPAGSAAAVHGAVPGDFNGDGYRDLVLPVPGADAGSYARAGAVVVLYGSANGVSATSRRQTITEDSPGVEGRAFEEDQFGTTTATADLNRDGYADLVVGTPYNFSGEVTVLWGSRNGLTKGTRLPLDSQFQDYNGLDVAAAGLGTGSKTKILIGGARWTTVYKGPFATDGSLGSSVSTRTDNAVGSVALGDFNRSGSPDQVAFGALRPELSGSPIAVNHGGTQTWPEPLAHGNGLIAATGDVNGDGYADLVVGDPLEPVTPGADGELGGRVLVYRGSANGITRTQKPEVITQQTSGVPGTSEAGDRFGGGLAVADLNRDGAAEILVGAPYEAVGSAERAGAVTVIPGRRSGALGTGGYSFHQDTTGVPSSSEAGDSFGTTVAAGDLNRDGRPELTVGAAGENGGNGAVFVLPGGTSRPTGTGSRVFTLESLGMAQPDGWLGGKGLLRLLDADGDTTN
ncbi:FG-GAP-like repeat-containing protein [Streptomyces sp. enrichment culture]|uniref:FG-GAP-like repeat-containing protein n=1 Tax=Streptomyces sp. enrichment culture TaxID=1795815 RepID=UPI003F569658